MLFLNIFNCRPEIRRRRAQSQAQMWICSMLLLLRSLPFKPDLARPVAEEDNPLQQLRESNR